MDGSPPVSQPAVPPGGTFAYTVTFPDAGLYWYHPHVKEEMQQDLGLSGNIMVRGMPGLSAVDREEVLLLDDILIGDTGPVPYGEESATHALMGRFGNRFLVNGEPRAALPGRSGETIRLWFTNAANTRTFNLSVAGATLRLVAADMGAFPAPPHVESVVLAPAWVQNTTTGAGPEDGGPAPRRGARALRAGAGRPDRDGRASRGSRCPSTGQERHTRGRL